MATYSFSALLLLCTFTTAHSTELPLPLVEGYVADTMGEPHPYTALQMAAMTDLNMGTGLTYTSHHDDSTENQINGIRFHFEFDISAFAHVDSLVMSWSGTHEWAPDELMESELARFILLGKDYYGDTWFQLPVNSSPEIRSGTLVLSGFKLDESIHDGLVQLTAGTYLWTSDGPWEFIRMSTVEVSVRAYGELAATPAGATSWGAIKDLYRR